jgi:methylenetetrahydrofolate dehydrogenase (NADP+)/methenyltetrahydrofolate cyclohydrolase
MTIVDGKRLAQNILEEVSKQVSSMATPPKLAVFTCNPNFETKKYLTLKQAKAATLGVELTVINLPFKARTQDLIDEITKSIPLVNGIIVQLPLPAHIDTSVVLGSVPTTRDVDAFAYEKIDGGVLPPVVGAIDEIAKEYQVDFLNKKVVIFGSGRLVGAPMLHYANKKGAKVTVLTEVSLDVEKVTQEADIIVLGVGQLNLLRPEMVKEGVVVFDAGASEDGGLLVGDSSPEVALRARVFTPVPGGIGPITIALLFRNLLELRSSQ